MRRTMRARTLFFMTLAVVLVPIQALGAVCFTFTGSGIPNVHVLAIELAGSGGPFFVLVGEDVATGFCAGQNGFPLTGTAYLRLDGKAAIGVNVHFVQDNTCAPFWVQGTLTPPAF